jgi:hypothetical protein
MKRIGGYRKIYDNHHKVICAKFAHTTTNNVQKMHVVMIPQQYEAVWKSRTTAEDGNL